MQGELIPPSISWLIMCRVARFVTGGLLPQKMRGSHWDGKAHAADWYTTIAAMAGASVTNTGPLPPDGVALYEAIVSNASSPRTEVVLQIMSNSSTNMFEPPSAEWCRTATVGDADLCNPPQRPSPPPRPFPALTTCNSSDANQRFTFTPSTVNGTICATAGTLADMCFNVQRSEDHIIFFERSTEKNEIFGLTDNGQIRGMNDNCIVAHGIGQQLTFETCGNHGNTSSTGWAFDSNSGALMHGGLCATYFPVPSGPVGLELGVLIQGEFKLIMGYPGWRSDWDGWITPPADKHLKSVTQAINGRNASFCEDTPCLFDIMTDPTEHNVYAQDTHNI